MAPYFNLRHAGTLVSQINIPNKDRKYIQRIYKTINGAVSEGWKKCVFIICVFYKWCTSSASSLCVIAGVVLPLLTSKSPGTAVD